MSRQQGNSRDRKDSTKGRKGDLKSKGFGKKMPKSKPDSKLTKDPNVVRLNKYIANSGICSRREADMYIQVGSVTVNGKVVNEMGFKVKLTDEVTFDGRRINPEPKAFVVLNKPKGFATTTSEAKGNTVMDLVSNATSARIQPIGRLGRNATGLLLFTNDDEFMQKFTRKGVSRLFHIELDKNFKSEDFKKLKDGLKIDGKKIEVEEISYVKNAPKKEIGMRIKHIGNSIIRTIFEHLRYQVVKVDCVTIGPITKKDLPRGRWRHLTDQEKNTINML